MLAATKKRSLLSQRGFTLVEVMITSVLGLLAIAAVGAALDNGARLSTDNRARLYAINAIRKEIETLRNTSYDTVVGYGASSSFTNTQLGKLESGTGTRAISSSFGSDIKKVTLTVSWTRKNRSTMTESMTTYLTRKGLNGA